MVCQLEGPHASMMRRTFQLSRPLYTQTAQQYRSHSNDAIGSSRRGWRSSPPLSRAELTVGCSASLEAQGLTQVSLLRDRELREVLQSHTFLIVVRGR
jgi:hypothetical protein